MKVPLVHGRRELLPIRVRLEDIYYAQDLYQMNRAWPWILVTVGLGVGCSGTSDPRPDGVAGDVAADTGLPNIVLIVADSANLSEPSRHDLDQVVHTLANDGVTFSNMESLGGSLAAMHSALLTGMHPAALGLDATSQTDGNPDHDADLASERLGLQRTPPAGIRVFPELLRAAGYYTVRSGESHHNLRVVPDTAQAAWSPRAARTAGDILGAWDASGAGRDWRRAPGEPCTVAFGCGGYTGEHDGPFFVQFNIPNGSSDAVDGIVLDILDKLESDALVDDTVVLLTDVSGVIPLVARWPGRIEAGTLDNENVTLLDLAPTVLALAKTPVPSYVRGHVLGSVTAMTGPERLDVSNGSSEKSAAELWVDGRVPVAAAPQGYPTGGVFHVAPRVELSCETEGSSIVYATELAPPFYWRLYTGPFRMRFWTLRFQCGRLGYADSPVVTYDFDIE